MNKCKDCIWHDDCTCVVCEDENMVVCYLQHKHKSKNDNCERFAPIEEKKLKGDHTDE
jgi:hypothetical protein